MYRKGILFALSALTIGLASCVSIIHGSGKIIDSTPDFHAFKEIHISSGIEAVIRGGEDFAVKIRTDDNILEHLDVYELDSTLYVGVKTASFIADATMNVEITLPLLAGVNASGGSEIVVGSVISFSRQVCFTCSGGSVLNASCSAPQVELSLSGGSEAIMDGACSMIALDLSGGSTANLKKYEAQKARIDASGGSEIHVRVSDYLDASLSGGSIVEYKGTPKLGTISVSGGSEVRRIK